MQILALEGFRVRLRRESARLPPGKSPPERRWGLVDGVLDNPKVDAIFALHVLPFETGGIRFESLPDSYDSWQRLLVGAICSMFDDQMNNKDSAPPGGRVASLHLHPVGPGAPLASVESVEFVEAKGIQGDTRYFGRRNGDTGKPARRQVTLMEREQIAEHAAALGLPSIPPGAVRANIETTGIDLIALVGEEVSIGQAVLFLYAPRDPCEKMDAICKGLRELMLEHRQGVLAEVRRSGIVQIGDEVRKLSKQPGLLSEQR